MNADEFWQAVGEALLVQRTRRGWTPTDVQYNNGPNYKTVQANEQGRIGTVEKLTQHAEALGVSIVDVFCSVLDRKRRPLNPEALYLLRKYETTTLEGRRALVVVAQAVPDAAPGKPPSTSE